jgi:ADP-ribosylglycohydrolase
LKNNKPDLYDQYRGSIIGTAIGDALGAPMETMFAKDIKAKYPHFGRSSGYISSDSRKAGEWTDDTQLMIPTAQSICVNKGAISPIDIAERYAFVFENETLRGWGRSTIESVRRLTEGVPWFEASEDSVGTGNGAAMKAAPLGIVLSCAIQNGRNSDVKHCLNSIIDVGKITHKEIGIRASFLHSILVSMAILPHYTDYKNMINQLCFCENIFFNSTRLSDRVRELCRIKNIAQICKTGGITSKAEESWPTTAAVFLFTIKENKDPIDSLYELIRQGGDCDSTGAMFGSLIGAKFGVDVFDFKLVKLLQDNKMLFNLAHNLYMTLNHSEDVQYNDFSFFRI